jgi:hypothetical protein
MDMNINDPRFARAMAEGLLAMTSVNFRDVRRDQTT